MKRNDDKKKKSFKKTVMDKLSKKRNSDVPLAQVEASSHDLESVFSNPDTISYIRALLLQMDDLRRKIQAGSVDVVDKYHEYEKAMMAKLSDSAIRLGHDVAIKSDGGLEFAVTVRDALSRKSGVGPYSNVLLEDSMSGLKLAPSSFATARVGSLGVNGEVYDGTSVFNRGDNVTFLYSEPYNFNRDKVAFSGPSNVLDNSAGARIRPSDGVGTTRRGGSVPVVHSTSLLGEQGTKRVGSLPVQYYDRAEEALLTEYVLPGDYATIGEIEDAMSNNLNDSVYVLDNFDKPVEGQEDDYIYQNVVVGHRYQDDSDKGSDYEQRSSEGDDIYINASLVGRQRFDGRDGVQNEWVRGVQPLEQFPEAVRDRSAFVGPRVATQTPAFATGRPSFYKNKSDGRAL